MSNRLDPDQARHFVGPDLDPNGLQKLSADDTSRKELKNNIYVNKKCAVKKLHIQVANNVDPDKTVKLIWISIVSVIRKFCVDI